MTGMITAIGVFITIGAMALALLWVLDWWDKRGGRSWYV